MFSKRLDYNISENRISRLFEEKKSKGINILDLTISNPTIVGFNYNGGKVIKSISKKKSLIYEPNPKGIKSARDAVSGYYLKQNILIDSDNIYLTSSTSEAYSFIFKLITNPFDEILIPCPSYPLFSYIADMESLNQKYYKMLYNEKDFWIIDFEDLKSQISSLTKAIIIVNPNNPTGNFVKQEEYYKLLDICRENNIALISDEVFFDYSFNTNKNCIYSFAGTNNVLTFTLSGLSKICGLPQMKLSWIIVNGNDKIRIEAKSKLDIISDTYLSVGTPIQHGLGDLLNNKDIIQEQIKNRIRDNYNFLKEATYSTDLMRLLKTEGGWYSIFRVINRIDDDAIAYDLLDKKDVFVHPGYFFDFTEEGYLIVSLLTPVNDMKEGVKRIMEYLKVLN